MEADSVVGLIGYPPNETVPFPIPPIGEHVLVAFLQARRRILPGFEQHVPADIGANPVQTGWVDFRPDIVDQCTGNPICVGRRENHGANAAKRRSDEDGVCNAQLVEQLEDVRDII